MKSWHRKRPALRCSLPVNRCHLDNIAIGINCHHRDDPAFGEEDMIQGTVRVQKHFLALAAIDWTFIVHDGQPLPIGVFLPRCYPRAKQFCQWHRNQGPCGAVQAGGADWPDAPGSRAPDLMEAPPAVR